jgi:hypothetical protein
MFLRQMARAPSLAKRYAEADQVRVKIALATEVRLTETAIARLLKLIDTEVPLDQIQHLVRAWPQTGLAAPPVVSHRAGGRTWLSHEQPLGRMARLNIEQYREALLEIHRARQAVISSSAFRARHQSRLHRHSANIEARQRYPLRP